MIKLNFKMVSVIQKIKKASLIKWSIIIVCFVIVFLISLFYNNLQNQIHQISKTQEEQKKKQTETNQFLLSTVDWASKRQKLILFMTKQITNEWERVGIKSEVEIAYNMAEAIEFETEKYPSVDPLFMLALGCIESAFGESRVSDAGAIGFFQIMPATGRLLCECFNMSYDDTLLFSYKTNTKLAAKLLEPVLAAYNGGPYQAYYYQKYKDKLAEETKEFVPNVCKKYLTYQNLFDTYRVDSTLVPVK
jgi:hypothetical protein